MMGQMVPLPAVPMVRGVGVQVDMAPADPVALRVVVEVPPMLPEQGEPAPMEEVPQPVGSPVEPQLPAP